MSHEIARGKDRCAREDRQIDPRLPVVNGPSGDKEENPHYDGEYREAEPCFCIEIRHRLSAFDPRGHGCNLTPQRTASRPTVSLRLMQIRKRAAMQ